MCGLLLTEGLRLLVRRVERCSLRSASCQRPPSVSAVAAWQAEIRVPIRQIGLKGSFSRLQPPPARPSSTPRGQPWSPG